MEYWYDFMDDLLGWQEVKKSPFINLRKHIRVKPSYFNKVNYVRTHLENLLNTDALDELLRF